MFFLNNFLRFGCNNPQYWPKNQFEKNSEKKVFEVFGHPKLMMKLTYWYCWIRYKKIYGNNTIYLLKIICKLSFGQKTDFFHEFFIIFGYLVGPGQV